VTPDLGLIVYAAERDAHEVAAGRLGNRLAERGLADARRTGQAQDRPGQFVGALLDGEIFDDALLDLLDPVMVVVENLLGVDEILIDLRLLIPRDRQQPIEIVAHDAAFRRHRRYLPELLELVGRLLAASQRTSGASLHAAVAAALTRCAPLPISDALGGIIAGHPVGLS
jgi:hypothetical protein